MIIIFCFVPCLKAEENFTFDSEGNLYQFWLEPTLETKVLKLAKSINQGLSFSSPFILYTFTQEVKSVNLKLKKDKDLLISYVGSQEINLLIKREPSFAEFKPQTLFLTAEAVSADFDEYGKIYLAFLSKNPQSKLNQIKYLTISHFPSLEAEEEVKTLFESYEEITGLNLFLTPWGPAIAWQKPSLDYKESYLMLSLDQGEHFSQPFLLKEEFYPLFFLAGKWHKMTRNGQRIAFEPIIFPTPSAPKLVYPTEESVTKNSSMEIIYYSFSTEPVIGRIEISTDENFLPEKTWIFEKFSLPGTNEVHYPLPFPLPEGTYFLRLSCFNGLSQSNFSNKIIFKTDYTPPQLVIISPTTETWAKHEVKVVGKVNEKAVVTLNGTCLTPEADGTFNSSLTLSPGENRLFLCATDEAGNQTTLSKKLTYLALAPEINILKPSTKDWLKPGSTLIFEAEVTDPQNDLEDETEAKLDFFKSELDYSLVYEKASQKLTGFITLPEDLEDGKYPAKVVLTDQAGHTGEAQFEIRIDHEPPKIEKAFCFTNSPSRFTLPLTDKGAGLDPSGTLVKTSGTSIEVFASGESLVAKIPTPLLEGSYEVKVLPRDLVGNAGELSTFFLQVDFTAPKLILFSTPEGEIKSSKLIIEGKAEDEFLASVKVYDRQKLVANCALNQGLFRTEIPLTFGNHEIKVVAEDQAGNQAVQSFNVFTQYSTTSLLSSCQSGPNPFSPGQTTYFTFDLASPANLKLYIFDLLGTLIWQREFKNLASGYHNEISWDGRDYFGNLVKTGVYFYLLQATSSDKVELRRGKIIVLQ